MDAGRFEVDVLEPPVWDTGPYDNLVLPAGEKELLMAVADHRQAQLAAFDDFVKAKGECPRIKRKADWSKITGRGKCQAEE